MEVIEIKEPKDGFCELVLEMTEEESRMLIEIGVNKILKEQIERMKKEK